MGDSAGLDTQLAERCFGVCWKLPSGNEVLEGFTKNAQEFRLVIPIFELYLLIAVRCAANHSELRNLLYARSPEDELKHLLASSDLPCMVFIVYDYVLSPDVNKRIDIFQKIFVLSSEICLAKNVLSTKSKILGRISISGYLFKSEYVHPWTRKANKRIHPAIPSWRLLRYNIRLESPAESLFFRRTDSF